MEEPQLYSGDEYEEQHLDTRECLDCIHLLANGNLPKYHFKMNAMTIVDGQFEQNAYYDHLHDIGKAKSEMNTKVILGETEPSTLTPLQEINQNNGCTSLGTKMVLNSTRHKDHKKVRCIIILKLPYYSST